MAEAFPRQLNKTPESSHLKNMSRIWSFVKPTVIVIVSLAVANWALTTISSGRTGLMGIILNPIDGVKALLNK